jgi:cytosine/adenosine deaminase-related metal-dependent hydrolase
VDYLRALGILDHQTLCVHAIHISDEEIRILAGESVKICLCPGSNRYLNTGKAPVRAYLDHGILPALGTDSLASNPELSLWREMRILAEDFPTVEPSEIFKMATLGGAETLGLGHRLGTLEPGKDADLLVVPISGSVRNAEQVFHFLVGACEHLEPERILH